MSPLEPQIMRLRPTEPVPSSTPFGDIKIPDPEKLYKSLTLYHKINTFNDPEKDAF